MNDMTREEFAEIVREAIRTNVTAGIPCGCCGAVEMDGIGDAVAEATAAVFGDSIVRD